jgi:hypothetical protein
MATGPAPDQINGKLADGPLYIGFTPARGGEDLTLYEIAAPEDLVLQRDGNIDEYHSRIAEVFRARKDVRQLDYRKDLNLLDLPR